MPIALSTLADQVGAACTVLKPLLERIEAHVFAAERLHGDDTTVPVLAKGKTHTADAGSTFAMTGRLMEALRLGRCSTTHAIVAARISRRTCALVRRTPGRRLCRIQSAL